MDIPKTAPYSKHNSLHKTLRFDVLHYFARLWSQCPTEYIQRRGNVPAFGGRESKRFQFSVRGKYGSMCIAVFLWQSHPLYPLLMLLNRDEYHNRPAEALAWWPGGEILGGRDGLAGGTWLACSRDGRLAFLTNVREVISIPEAKSRGDLIVRFLESKKSPMEFAEEVVREADQYNGFNLIMADICSKTMVYITNRPREDNATVTEVSPGIHVLSNARLDSPWPKAQRLSHNFKELLDKYGEGEIPTEEMVEKLMKNTIKDDEIILPGIYPPEREHQLSSIFVDTDTPLGRYGTRSTSSVCVRASGEVNFYEKHLENETWREHTVTYQIERMKQTALES